MRSSRKLLTRLGSIFCGCIFSICAAGLIQPAVASDSRPVSPLRAIVGFCLFPVVYEASALAAPNSCRDTIVRRDTTRVDPEPEVGIDAYFKYIDKNHKISKEARRARKNGIVFIDFVIEADGSMSNVRIAQDLGNGTGEEGVRVIKSGPKWKAGTLNGAPERSVMRIPIRAVPPPSLKDLHRRGQTSDAIKKMTR